MDSAFPGLLINLFDEIRTAPDFLPQSTAEIVFRIILSLDQLARWD
jgi:hypothetical protein